MQDYDIHFYTAATRRYGEFCIELIKHELLRHSQKSEKQVKFKQQVESSLTKNRLITRDDKHRFSETSNFARTEAELENMRRAERIVLSQTNGAVTLDI